jgi:fibro-slime domain-containing protein/MYXO-CTERM domain-containing protein
MRSHGYKASLALLALLAVSAPRPAHANILNIPITLRDFSPLTNPDFEYTISDDRGIVSNDLGVDGTPTYAHGAGSTATVHSAATFGQWYHDTPGVNLPFASSLNLDDAGHPGIFNYTNFNYFPLDGQGFGNEGNSHNFHFTLEMHSKFTYQGGETFDFLGDDDVFVFINKKLALDLGGVHGAEAGSVNLDAAAAALGITTGNDYNFDFFFNERHTVASELSVSTSLQLRSTNPTPEPSSKVFALMGLAMLAGGAWMRRRA